MTVSFTKLVRKSILGFFTISVFKAKMAKQDEYVRYTIRVPADIYEHVSNRAEENGRSVNAEIVYRLQTTIDMDDYIPSENAHPEEPGRAELRSLSEMIARATEILERMEKKGE